jgi:hypothetical protein
MKFAINLPWPDKALSPNARVHWAIKARVAKNARKNAYWAGMSEGLHKIKTSAVSITRIYSPPNRKRRDKDNLDASMKAYLDGLSDAMGIDDYHFDLEKSVISEPVKNGNVCFIIREASPFSQDAIEDDGFVTITPMEGNACA